MRQGEEEEEGEERESRTRGLNGVWIALAHARARERGPVRGSDQKHTRN